MLLLLGAHLAAAACAPALLRALGRRGWLVLAAVPAAAAAWTAWTVLAAPASRVDVAEHVDWVPALGLSLGLRMDTLGALMSLLVGGVGALVLVYCAGYLRDGPGTGRFAAVFVAFAGAMLALVWADDVLLLYVCWELTTVCSFLLIGHEHRRQASRRAATQALLVTTAGGLAMLVGLLVLSAQAGTTSLAALVAAPPSGTATTVAVALVLVGAASKSALVPFHFWLPAAMAAPTPVSAYLHAAAMVKAGVYLVARLAPGFAGTPGWRPGLLVAGLATMLLGGWTALRQKDLKLLLAHGTVSQLGLLVVLVSAGTPVAALAGAALLLAHAMYKSALFLVVGILDAGTGTRNLRELSGMGRRHPRLAAAAGLAAASMAGVPLLAGFVAKEAAYEAYWAGEAGLPLAWSRLALAGVVAGSVLTVGYAGRFWWGAFATKPGRSATRARPVPRTMAAPVAALAAAGLAVGLLAGPVGRWLAGYADGLGADGGYGLALWHGATVPLGLSALTLALGAVVAVRSEQVRLLAKRGPRLGDAQRAYRAVLRGLDRVALQVTGTVQPGSLSLFVGTVVVVVTVLPAWWLVRAAAWPAQWRAWDTPWQAAVAVPVVVAAAAATRLRGRLGSVLLVGVTGYGTGVLFALHGAPDLALTQFLVETLTLVVFVLVLRKLPQFISERHTRGQRLLRAAVAVPAGAVLAALGAVALGSRREPGVGADFAGPAQAFGGGGNVVNVTLVDIRAWDTFGEVSVLVAAAVGVASLVFLRRRSGTPPRPQDAAADPALPDPPEDRARGEGAWLAAQGMVDARQRSVLLEVAARVLFHSLLVLSVYLLLAGHNAPGGGFAGGLVAGLALVVRYVAAGPYELGEAAPVDAGLLLGAGLILAGATGAAAMVAGGQVLESTIVSGDLPLFGPVKLVTSLFFDVGVYLVVVGLVLDVLRSLGAELEHRRTRAVLAAPGGAGRPADQGAR